VSAKTLCGLERKPDGQISVGGLVRVLIEAKVDACIDWIDNEDGGKAVALAACELLYRVQRLPNDVIDQVLRTADDDFSEQSAPLRIVSVIVSGNHVSVWCLRACIKAIEGQLVITGFKLLDLLNTTLDKPVVTVPRIMSVVRAVYGSWEGDATSA